MVESVFDSYDEPFVPFVTAPSKARGCCGRILLCVTRNNAGNLPSKRHKKQLHTYHLDFTITLLIFDIFYVFKVSSELKNTSGGHGRTLYI